MLYRIKKAWEKFMTFIIEKLKNLLTLATFFSFIVLFGLFFFFLYKEDAIMCLVCLAGIYTFVHLNKSL